MLSYFFLRNTGDELISIKIVFCTPQYIYFCSIACLKKVNKVDRKGATHILGFRCRSYFQISVASLKSLPLYYVSLQHVILNVSYYLPTFF